VEKPFLSRQRCDRSSPCLVYQHHNSASWSSLFSMN
jgi:hypothetical protein